VAYSQLLPGCAPPFAPWLQLLDTSRELSIFTGNTLQLTIRPSGYIVFSTDLFHESGANADLFGGFRKWEVKERSQVVHGNAVFEFFALLRGDWFDRYATPQRMKVSVYHIFFGRAVSCRPPSAVLDPSANYHAVASLRRVLACLIRVAGFQTAWSVCPVVGVQRNVDHEKDLETSRADRQRTNLNLRQKVRLLL